MARNAEIPYCTNEIRKKVIEKNLRCDKLVVKQRESIL